MLLGGRIQKYGGWQLQRQWAKLYFYLQSRDLIVSAYSWNRAAALASCEMLHCWSASGQHLLCKGWWLPVPLYCEAWNSGGTGSKKQLKKMWLPTSDTVPWLLSSNSVLSPPSFSSHVLGFFTMCLLIILQYCPSWSLFLLTVFSFIAFPFLLIIPVPRTLVAEEHCV